MEKEATGIRAEMWSAFGIPFSRVEYTDHEFAPHFHDHYVIMNVRSGINLGRKERKTYAIDRSHLLILEPGAVHTGSSWGGHRLVYEAMYPNHMALANLMSGFEINMPTNPTFNSHVMEDPELLDTFNQLFHSISDEAEGLEVDSHISLFLSAFCSKSLSGPNQSPAKQENSVMRRAISHIADRHSESVISLQAISQHAGVSPHYLVRLFRRSCGQTPFEYLRNYRVERAKDLMRGNQTLTEIALATGFYDQSHFIRCFRTVTGWAPGLYRKALRGA